MWLITKTDANNEQKYLTHVGYASSKEDALLKLKIHLNNNHNNHSNTSAETIFTFYETGASEYHLKSKSKSNIACASNSNGNSSTGLMSYFWFMSKGDNKSDAVVASTSSTATNEIEKILVAKYFVSEVPKTFFKKNDLLLYSKAETFEIIKCLSNVPCLKITPSSSGEITSDVNSFVSITEPYVSDNDHKDHNCDNTVDSVAIIDKLVEKAFVSSYDKTLKLFSSLEVLSESDLRAIINMTCGETNPYMIMIRGFVFERLNEDTEKVSCYESSANMGLEHGVLVLGRHCKLVGEFEKALELFNRITKSCLQSGEWESIINDEITSVKFLMKTKNLKNSKQDSMEYWKKFNQL